MSSDNIQPIDQISIYVEYLFSINMISGARYHLDTTWLDNFLFSIFLYGRSSINFYEILFIDKF
jgi:hypothetical protein